MKTDYKVGDKVIWHHIRQQEVNDNAVVEMFDKHGGEELTVKSVSEASVIVEKLGYILLLIYFEELIPFEITDWQKEIERN